MIKTVCFIAQNVAETIDPDYSTAMISIRSPGFEVKLQPDWNHLHISEFNDIDTKMYPWKLFDKEQARAMIDFLDNLPDHVDAVIVHCEAGISRSAAVALFIQDYYGASLTLSFRDTSMHNRHVRRTLEEVYNDNPL